MYHVISQKDWRKIKLNEMGRQKTGKADFLAVGKAHSYSLDESHLKEWAPDGLRFLAEVTIISAFWISQKEQLKNRVVMCITDSSTLACQECISETPLGVHKHQWENMTNFTTAINQNINYKGLGHNGKTRATDQNINYKLLGNNGKTTAINHYKQLGHNSRMPATNQNINYKHGHNCKTPVINNYKQLGHNGHASDKPN